MILSHLITLKIFYLSYCWDIGTFLVELFLLAPAGLADYISQTVLSLGNVFRMQELPTGVQHQSNCGTNDENISTSEFDFLGHAPAVTLLTSITRFFIEE
ncbi:hypothetical protein OUZ56_031206 [Daphnia magna]|uniref:Uncharacterized protein n=1 Tax=Daphnia magna TaxID=35525 RepID=A0ABQ9ZTK8_9CRUS|nr:hypothetical protein OUZ56_031206 [Daphnia magna]